MRRSKAKDTGLSIAPGLQTCRREYVADQLIVNITVCSRHASAHANSSGVCNFFSHIKDQGSKGAWHRNALAGALV
jgi:hypothetical protein